MRANSARRSLTRLGYCAPRFLIRWTLRAPDPVFAHETRTSQSLRSWLLRASETRTKASGSTIHLARPRTITREPRDRHCTQTDLVAASMTSSTMRLLILADMAEDLI